MRCWKIFPLLVLLLTAALLPQPALAQAQTQVLKTTITHILGQQITFVFLLKTPAPIENAIVFFQGQGDTYTNLGEMQISKQSDGAYELSYVHSMEKYRLRAFSKIEYHFEVRMQGNQKFESQSGSYDYYDNRFDWQTLQESPFQVYWYEGDIAFAQSVLDMAQQGAQRLQELLPLPIPTNVRIYIYPDARTMQDTLNPSSQSWIAGHADPDLGVVVVALPPGPEQRLLMEQRIPHELMHIALYQATGRGYANLPTWLNEGLAAQTELYPNPDYDIVLNDAAAKNTLLSMTSLCQNFSRNAATALLSYAQSSSFVGYLHSTYGASGLQKLVNSYANGVDCDRGAKLALGSSLSQLERQWQRDALNKNMALSIFLNLLPWIVMLLAVLAVPLMLTAPRLRHAA